MNVVYVLLKLRQAIRTISCNSLRNLSFSVAASLACRKANIVGKGLGRR